MKINGSAKSPSGNTFEDVAGFEKVLLKSRVDY